MIKSTTVRNTGDFFTSIDKSGASDGPAVLAVLQVLTLRCLNVLDFKDSPARRALGHKDSEQSEPDPLYCINPISNPITVRLTTE